ncbi:unnamed protein product [Schistosoma margrebowiei]|uniref:Uncharacterized protein n=1 Tax=Schistosoma margrebowiei TaxID=48269 RepID=A0A183MZR0_9TREM|nr:unnamed protein product [Schistosoma margrebowiei]
MESNVVDLDGTNECNNISKRIKIILVGNSNVGKSRFVYFFSIHITYYLFSLVKSFTKGSDENEPVSTIGTDLKLYEMRLNGELIKLYIWPARAISIQKAEEYAKSINCVYLETSAKTGLHVRQAFITLVHLVSYVFIYSL